MTVLNARSVAMLFDPKRLELARAFNGMRKIDLAKHLGLTPSAVTQLEQGASKPTAAHLTQIAFALGFPVDFFINDGKRTGLQDHGRAFFRSLRATRQIDRDRAEAQAFLVSEVVSSIERRVRLPDVDLPGHLQIGQSATRDEIERRAEELRTTWDIPAGPIANVVRVLESHGIIVTHCSIECQKVSSFSRWFSSRPVVVLGAEKTDLPRLRSDAAHELGHLILHAEVEPGNQILENQAQAFAASFLMPRSQIAVLLPKTFDLQRYGTLKQVWGVSIQALLYRAKELRVMSDATYRRAMMTISQRQWRQNEPFPVNGKENASILTRSMEVLKRQAIDTVALARETRLPVGFVEQVVNPSEDTRAELTF
jgi:Zn-dependent peptidase ImmA (M78 family)/transcriptional regulator with XRE-family HTH domain